MSNAAIPISKATKMLFYGFSAVSLLAIFIAVATEFYYLAAAPVFLLLIYFTVVDFRKIFYLLLICIPLSTEINLPNGFGTDLPTEPLMVGLMLVFFLYALRHNRELGGQFFRHPITLLLLLHVGWIVIATIFSSLFFVSFKYLLAKIWYITTFYFLAGFVLRKRKDIQQAFWCIFIPLVFTIFYSLARHSQYDFSFEYVYKAFHPFYRNHVTYASIVATFVPFIWFVGYWYRRGSRQRRIINGGFLLTLIAIQLSYTRAAYVVILVAVGAYFIIRWRLTKYVLALSVIGAIGLVGFLAVNNRYLDYAPDYEKTITFTDFNNLLEATYQREDISTMERVYRWIAGGYMSKEKPLFGFGPGNFYNFYQIYTVKSFRTYVSNNPEKSGIHSYYLMTLVEQGYPGLIIYITMLFFVLLRGEHIYYQTRKPRRKQIVMIALLMIIIISTLQTINDLLETDKIGPFFFISMAILVNMDINNKNKISPIKE